MIYSDIHEDLKYRLPQAFGGCTCICHRQPNVMHIMPCCYPTKDDDIFVPTDNERKSDVVD